MHSFLHESLHKAQLSHSEHTMPCMSSTDIRTTNLVDINGTITVIHYRLLPSVLLTTPHITPPAHRRGREPPWRFSRLKPGPHQQQCRSNVRHCCQKRQQCRTSFALKLRPFDKVERCFDIVAQNGNIVEATGNKVAC